MERIERTVTNGLGFRVLPGRVPRKQENALALQIHLGAMSFMPEGLSNDDRNILQAMVQLFKKVERLDLLQNLQFESAEEIVNCVEADAKGLAIFDFLRQSAKTKNQNSAKNFLETTRVLNPNHVR